MNLPIVLTAQFARRNKCTMKSSHFGKSLLLLVAAMIILQQEQVGVVVLAEVSFVSRRRRSTGPSAGKNYARTTMKTTSKQRRSSSMSIDDVAQRLLAGGTSRALAQITLYPIDALRTLAQTRDARTLADVGTSALVRGCVTTSTFALFMGSIQFAVFGVCRSHGVPTLVSSALGAAASCIVSIPQEVLKQNLVAGVYSSFGEAVASIFKTEGIRGFYNAWKPTMARNVPFVMTTFTTMEILKRQRIKRKVGSEKELTLVENMAIGMSSALVAGLLTQYV